MVNLSFCGLKLCLLVDFPVDLELWLFHKSDLLAAMFRRWSGYSLMYNAHCTAVNVFYYQNGKS